ncbi:unnamed protein product [Withania somnifera]
MGAEFLSVRIKCRMSEILDHPHAESVVFPKDLPWANICEGGNLLVAQVSEFDCWGIAISLCLSHKIGDGCSVLNFVNDWSGLTRDPTRTTLIPSPRFLGDSIFSAEKYDPLITPQIVPDLTDCVQKRLIFPTVSAESGVENPTQAEIVSVILFKCATKAASTTSTSMGQPKLVNFLNVRTMIKPRLTGSAIGNVLSIFSTPAINTNNEEEMKLPRLKDHVEQNELILQVVNSMRNGKRLFENKDENCTVYVCSNITKFRFYGVDFGWGKPERVCIANGFFKNLFFLTDYQMGRGVEAQVMLHKQHNVGI